MGEYTFTWEHAASEVYVTGDFDEWKKTVKLENEGGIFKKTVELPKQKHQYKFVVDGNWVTNESAPKEPDSNGIFNNVLTPDDIKDPISTLSSAAPESSTAALAGAMPKEDARSKSEDSIPGAFPLTPPAETPSNEPQAFSINPLPATAGLGNPIHLAPGEKVPEPSTFTDNTVQSTVKHDPEPEEATVSVAPLPATAGAGNPIHLEPGEKVPDPSTFTSNTIASTVKTDPESYEKGAPPQLGPVVTSEAERDTKGSMFGLPPIAGGLIPESSLPMKSDAKTEQDPGVTIQSAAPTSTTAALAGQVPLEPKGVPETVTESQKEAGFAPEASANPEAVQEKKELEQELKEKVPEEPPTAEGSTIGQAGAAAAAGATVTAGAFAAATYAAKEKAAETVGLNGQATASEVPEVVAESQKEAHASPEASANPKVVEEKKEVETELLKEVKKVTESGEPAPTVTAATSETAPGLSGEGLTDTKPLKSSSEPDALNAPASKPAVPEIAQPIVDSRDVSPMSKQPTTQQTQPTVTTGVESSTTEAKSTPETPKKDSTAPESAKGTPESVASGATDKKKKRRSIFGKLKEKFSSK
ncbi:carbohydrate-binding module family 48 protein [Lentithecium fluviatile CBS 122367]|uniref:Carbohydrate-binding module family 48 protein n=1 Tax=Lentithecium fluviatile CBS 122367 TaxID=1168545 RepID=A0A6G1IY85_9PLEO|nr:carbohydrate-binding module family 48 protein [Lentithecium fluviatile CBS 122367]